MTKHTKPLSDAQLMRWLRDHLEWDGYGYWLPEICVRELKLGEEFCEDLGMAEFRAVLSDHARGGKE